MRWIRYPACRRFDLRDLIVVTAAMTGEEHDRTRDQMDIGYPSYKNTLNTFTRCDRIVTQSSLAGGQLEAIMRDHPPTQALLNLDAEDRYQHVASSPEQAASIFARRFPDEVVVGDPHVLFFGNNGGSGSHGILGSTVIRTAEEGGCP